MYDRSRPNSARNAAIEGRVQPTERLIEIRAVPVETENRTQPGLKTVPSVGNRNSLRCLTVAVGRVIVRDAGSDADVLDGVVDGTLRVCVRRKQGGRKQEAEDMDWHDRGVLHAPVPASGEPILTQARNQALNTGGKDPGAPAGAEVARCMSQFFEGGSQHVVAHASSYSRLLSSAIADRAGLSRAATTSRPACRSSLEKMRAVPRKMSAEARKAVSGRMKRYRAERRKAQTKVK